MELNFGLSIVGPQFAASFGGESAGGTGAGIPEELGLHPGVVADTSARVDLESSWPTAITLGSISRTWNRPL